METQGIGVVGIEKVPEFNDPLRWKRKKLEKVPNLINEGEVGKLQNIRPPQLPAPNNANINRKMFYEKQQYDERNITLHIFRSLY